MRISSSSFPEFPVVGGLRSADPNDSTDAGVDECPDLLRCCDRGSQYFSSIEWNMFYSDVRDPDLDVDGQVG